MDKTEITKLLMASNDKLSKYATSLTWSHDRAGDLLQDTALRILMNADKFNDSGNFLGWAKTIMHNTFINSAKHEERQTAVKELLYPLNERNNSSCYYYDHHVDISYIYQAIDTLPQKQNKIMKLYISGHKYLDIAMELKIPIGTVKTNISLSRATLKEKLKDYLN